MTEENYRYRTGQAMLRNQFEGDGKMKIPMIRKAEFDAGEFQNLLMIGFDRARADDNRNCERMVHFFLYDYKFERVWRDPEHDLARLRNYRAVLSPDFSMYLEMNPTIQLYNTFRNRWCGAYWASKGLRVIPTVSWGDENTFEFCFRGIPKGSTVAVSTYMVSAHDNRCDQKEFFLRGYQELLRVVEPERVICYNTPFPEMEGNLTIVDYELSSWKYQKSEPIDGGFYTYLTKNKMSGLIYKRMIGKIIPGNKGMGSAYGGQWRPNLNKPQDMVFVGEPNTIKWMHIPGKHGGYWAISIIGPTGWAEFIRHKTDHGRPDQHSNPHDHYPVAYDPITHRPDWDNTPTHNYFDGVVPDYGGEMQMKSSANDKPVVVEYYADYDPEALRFRSIAEFLDVMRRGAEVVISWKDVDYGIFLIHDDEEHGGKHYEIAQCGTVEVNRATTMCCKTPDEILEYRVGGDRLRDVITQVEVLERTF